MQVFEGVRNKKGVRASPSRELTKGEKKRRVVLKRVNADNLGMRSDFLRSGTMAQVNFTSLPYYNQTDALRSFYKLLFMPSKCMAERETAWATLEKEALKVAKLTS